MDVVAVAFDTLKAATRLQDEAGCSEKQARGLVNTFAEGIAGNIATKQDLTALATKKDLAELATKADLATVHEDLAALRQDQAALREDHATLRGDLEKTELSLRGEMSKVQERLTVRMGAAVGTGVAILAVLYKVL